MTYEMYRYVFLGAAVVCATLLAVSLLLFFLLKIPKTISDLSGRTAKKAIENIRRHNEITGDKTYQSSAVNLQRGKLTDKISKSGRLIQREETPFGTGSITEEISTAPLLAEKDDNETTVLSRQDETTLLTEHPSVTEAQYVGENTHGSEFCVEFEITYIHTQEII